MNPKIGVEYEIPLLRADNAPASYEDNLRFWKALQSMGWSAKKDAVNGKIVGVSRRLRDGYNELTTDYGTCTFEAALPPVTNVAAVEKQWQSMVKNHLRPALQKADLQMMYCGFVPTTPIPLTGLVSPKSHYQVWNFHMGKYRNPIQHIGPGVCAVQFNIDSTVEECVPTINAFLKLSGLIRSMAANSAIVNGKPAGTLSLRHLLYVAFDRITISGYRVGTPRTPYTSISDIIQRAWSFPIFALRRNGAPWYQRKPRPISTSDFIRRGSAIFQDVKGKKKKLEVTVADLTLGTYFYWMDAKLKIEFDEKFSVQEVVDAVEGDNVEAVLKQQPFIEHRYLPMMDPEEMHAWAALILGATLNLRELERFTRNWTMSDARALFNNAATRGMKGTWKGKPVPYYGKKLVSVARAGLQQHQPSQLKYLEPIIQRLDNGRSPAHDAIELVTAQGIEEYVHQHQL